MKRKYGVEATISVIVAVCLVAAALLSGIRYGRSYGYKAGLREHQCPAAKIYSVTVNTAGRDAPALPGGIKCGELQLVCWQDDGGLFRQIFKDTAFSFYKAPDPEEPKK
jgi:hypothetical protein